MSQASPELRSQPPAERTPKSSATRGVKSSYAGSRGEAFAEGTAVEVRIDDDGFRGAWYEATVVGRVSQRRYQVSYASLVEDHDPSQPLSEVVRSSDIRPRPPPMPSPFPYTPYALHDLVEAFHNDGWWAGVVSGVVRGQETVRYFVSFPTSREEVELEASNLRYHLHWLHDQWVASSELGSEGATFAVGAHVQVSQQRENLGVAWFDANIIKVISSSTYLVEYETTVSEKGGGLLTEIVDEEYIRPFQPNLLQVENVSLNDSVEVLHHGGWVHGQISKVLGGSSYIVKICHDLTERKFQLAELRHSQYWNGKRWLVKLQQKATKSPAKSVSSQQTPQSHRRGTKRGRPRKSVSTSSDESEIIPRRGYFKSKLQQKKAAVQLESTPSLEKLKKDLLSKYHVKPHGGSSLRGGHATLVPGINFCETMPMVEPSPYILEWRNYNRLDGLPAFVTKKRTKIAVTKKRKIAVRKSIHHNGVVEQAQDESNKKSRETHMTNSLIPRRCQSPKKSAKDVILSNCRREKDDSSGQDLCRGLSLPQKSDALTVQVSPSFLDIVANSQVKNAISIYRVSKQLDRGHFSYIAPLNERLSAKNLTIEFLTGQSSPDISSSTVETGTCREICDSSIEAEIVPSVLAKGCTQIQHKAAPETLASENEGALSDPFPFSVASPLAVVQLPFQKTSAMWELVESMEAFKVTKQRPHFRTLELYSTEFQEGMAIGLMLSFANLFASVQEVNMDEAVNIDEVQASLMGKLKALGHLEANGFNVRALRDRIQQLLEIAAHRKECRARKAKLEAKILVEKANNDRIDFLASAFDRSIEELEQNLTTLRGRRDSFIAQRKPQPNGDHQAGNECSLC